MISIFDTLFAIGMCADEEHFSPKSSSMRVKSKPSQVTRPVSQSVSQPVSQTVSRLVLNAIAYV